MKLLIDGRVLAHSQFTGVERYTARVIESLRTVGIGYDVIQPRSASKYWQQLWEHSILPWKAEKYELLFCPANVAPIWKPRGCKYVVTIHDISFKLFKEAFSSSYRLYHDLTIRSVLRLADRVITVSDHERAMIEKYYPESAGKVRAVHNGVDDSFRMADICPAREKEKRILFVGSLNPRKNISGVIRAFNAIKGKVPHILQIVGARQGIYADTGIVQDERICYTGYVNDDELRELYHRAALFVFPSFYEGFGLPALEAMACGCPVITSNVSSLPEVVGDAAIQVAPHDTGMLAEAMLKVLKDEAASDRLIAAGRERVKQFTWERTARQTAEVFAECLFDAPDRSLRKKKGN